MTEPTLKEKISRAKTASIYKLWPLLGLVGDPSSINCSPFREDKKPSFYIVEDGSFFKDLARPGERGDCVDFVQKALGCGKGKAVNTILGYIDRGELDGEVVKKRDCPKPKPLLPQMSRGCKADLEALSNLRGFKVLALEKAVEMGILRFLENDGVRCWAITDDTGFSAQIRRLDGGLIQTTIKGKRLLSKSKTLRGSWSSHVIGLKEEGSPVIWLVEGGPDCLSAIQHSMVTNFEPRIGCMLGGHQKISDRCLPLFENATVWIWSHSDTAGNAAFDKWKKQLDLIAKKVSKIQFPKGVKDFNEFILSDYYSSNEYPQTIKS